MLDLQVAALIRTKGNSLPARVRTLRARAQTLCSKGKTAQGLRAYVNALHLLGAQPVLPED